MALIPRLATGTSSTGLDIGSSSIKMIQLKVDGGDVSVVAAEKVDPSKAPA